MAEQLIETYLGQLRAATWPLPASRREELVTEVRGHIEAALGAAATRDEAAVRTVLDRLGEPEAIAAAEVGEQGHLERSIAVPESRTERQAPLAGAVEIVALLLLAFGGIVPFVGVLAGYCITFLSTRWTTRDRAYAGAFLLASIVLAFVAAVRQSLADPDSIVYTSPLTMGFVAMTVAGWLAGVLLIAALLDHRRRASR